MDKKEYNRKYYQENKERWKTYNAKRRAPESKRYLTINRRANKYGLSVEEMEAITAKTKCDLCESTFGPREPHVDHCHRTGKVRGGLCSRCNLLLGQARDSRELLEKAIGYLEKWA